MKAEENAGEISSAQTVRSKYFTTGRDMDESLSDFQDPKILAGPKKATSKPKSDKPKKASKRIRGQKDIRTALQSKKKELESYAKDFDSVCKYAGIDVDSEQLQLAIALSKSLQPNTTESSGNSELSRSLSTQDRVGKIRTTLLEYGFKVPDIKITATGSRKLRKRKNYKLLETALEAKKQIISEKFSQVLFVNIRLIKNRSTDLDFTHIPLYHLATNASYSILKNGDAFYVDGLLEKSTSTGSLLRDWSEIPGRPESPRLTEPNNMNFSELECSQGELDIVLSGTLKSCKNVMESKQKDRNVSPNNLCNTINLEVAPIDDVNPIYQVLEYNESLISKETRIRDTEEPVGSNNHYRSCSPDIFDDETTSFINNSKDIFSQETREAGLSPQGVAVVLPDIDDVMDLTQYNQNKTLDGSQSKKHTSNSHGSENTNIKLNDVMEITDCVKVQYLDIYSANNTVSSQLSRNVTKRKSDDIMEITNCVSRPVNCVQTEVDIDLTQSPENIIPEANKTTKCTINNVIVNKTNSKNLTEVHQIDIDENTIEKDCDIVTCTRTEQPHVIDISSFNLKVTQEVNSVNIDAIEIDENDKTFDLTQSSNTSDELPFVSMEPNPKKQSADDTIIINPKEFEHLISNKPEQRETRSRVFMDKDEVVHSIHCVVIDDRTLVSFNDDQNEDIDLDLTQNFNREALDFTQEVVNTPRRDIQTEQDNVSFFEEYVHNHSDNNDVLTSEDNHVYKKPESPDVDLTQSPIAEIVSKCNESNDIDLTQDSDSSSSQLTQNAQVKDDVEFKDQRNYNKKSDKEDAVETEVVNTSQQYSTLAKRDDVSIVYELHENLADQYSQSQSNDISNCSQDSEVFFISDNELDYSMHQSKLERPVDNFLFGGISIMDELSDLGSSRKSTSVNNSAEAIRNVVDEEIEVIDNRTENTSKTPVKHKRVNELSTPQKPSGCGMITVLTPRNSEYITAVDVTPMPNYEDMSLEEIHTELDKFGVKPFKRKRAIQLLSHIYNQTHPTIEPYGEESPCKRQKSNDHESPTKQSPRKLTPRKVLSPKKTIKTPKKGDERGNGSTQRGKKTNEEILNMVAIQIDTRNDEVNDIPVIREVECSPDDWVFQKREKAKVHSCRVPLHVAFHNYLSSRRELREAILCYEPINIDDIHKDLVAYGHRYDPKDLLKFMDKKCITVKTTDNDARNHKR